MKPVVGYSRVLRLHIGVEDGRIPRVLRVENLYGRALGLIIASRNIIIDRYMIAAKTNLIQKYQDSIKLAVVIPSLLTKLVSFDEIVQLRRLLPTLLLFQLYSCFLAECSVL